MSNIVKIGDATLYHGDCLEILPTLDKVDAVVTSPPYNQIDPKNMRPSGMTKDRGAGLGWIEKFQEHGYADDKDESEYQEWLATIIAACKESCIGTVWVNHKTRYRDGIAIHPLSFLPFPLYSEVVWDRGGSLTLNANRYAPSHEYFFGFWKPVTWDASGNKRMSVWRISKEGQDGHVCAYPVKLVSPLIMDSTPADGVVLDPFMGSGTTGVACANLGRKFIGIEIERKYFDIACERIEAAYAQGRLFA